MRNAHCKKHNNKTDRIRALAYIKNTEAWMKKLLLKMANLGDLQLWLAKWSSYLVKQRNVSMYLQATRVIWQQSVNSR